jgi:hypothetical protein
MRTTGLWADGDTVVERRSQDVETNLDYAKALHNSGQHGSSELKHAAHFPHALVEKYIAANGINMHEFMVNPTHIRRMLNDPALGDFRIWKGRVPLK